VQAIINICLRRLRGAGRSSSIRSAIALLLFAMTLSVGVSTTAQTGGGSTGPAPASVKILTGALISPAEANARYGILVGHTDGICRDYGSKAELCPGGSGGAAPLAPELRELSRALRGGPGLNLQDAAAVQEHVDLVYEYVRNRIDTEFIFGSHKGALGAVIEGSGTAFDQASLMVKLLRASGVAADYRYGTITLTAEQFSAWTGISQAKAACALLAAGGVPATVSGGCTSAGSTSDVTLAHVWVAAPIGGQTYVYDPAYKTYDHVTGIDVRQAMGLSAGEALADATSGMNSGSTSSVPYVSGLNRSGLDHQLNTYATALLDRLEEEDVRGADMADTVGGRVMHAVSRPVGGWKQTSLPYASTPSATWSGGVGIPDQFRATLQLSSVLPGTTPTTMVAATFFVDEIYGRRLEITSSGGGPSLASAWAPILTLDGVAIFEGQGLYGAQNLVLHLDLTANHPFAAEGGDYADATVRKVVDYLQPAAIVHGWGHASAALSSKWEREQAVDREGPVIYQGGPPTANTVPGQGGATLGFLGGGDLLRARLGATWLAQFAMSRDLHAELAGARASHLHTLGVVSSNSNAVPTIESIGAPGGSLGGAGYAVQDETTVIDLESSFGLVSRTSDAVARRAAVHAVAATAATLEASVLQQLTETPDAASTASRFAWGNNPERLCADGGVYCETEQGAARAAHRYVSAAMAANAPSLVRYDNGTGAPTAFGGLPAVSGGVATMLKGNLASAVQSYADAGFDVTASAESNLGPGHRHGSEYALWTAQVGDDTGGATVDNSRYLACIIKRNPASSSGSAGPEQGGPCVGAEGAAGTWEYVNASAIPADDSDVTITTTGYVRLPTLQRGGALIANRYDASGDPLEIAHVLTRVGAPFKGGGGPSVTQSGRFDPNDAGQALRDQFVDRSAALGVNLTDGTARFTSPTLASVGQGEFPHSLDRRIEIRGGDLRPASSTAFEPVIVSNWDGEAKIASSAYEAMGQSRAQAAVPTIVAFVVMQDMWKAAPSAEREVAGALAADWWADHVLANLITIFQGADAQQFVRVEGDRFIAAGGGAATITLTGSRQAVRPNVVSPEAQVDPNRQDPQNWQKESTARQWTWSSGTKIMLRGAQGDEREYAYVGGLANAQYFEQGYHEGFPIQEWRFPFGVELSFTRATPGGQVTGVVSNTGLSLAVPLPGSSALAGGCASSTPGFLTLPPQPPAVLEVRDAANRLTKAEFRPSQTRTVDQRPHDACPLQRVFAPLSATSAALSYEFDSLGRIKAARDAIAIESPTTRGAHQMFIADGYRGERQDPLGGRYAVETLSDGQLQRHIDEMGRVSTATFDGSGRLISRKSAWGDLTSFTYDARDNLIQSTRTAIANCATGLTAEQQAWWCQTVTMKAEYHPTWNKPTKVILPATAADPQERTWDFSYNAHGLIETQTGPSVLDALTGNNARPVWDIDYDSFGRVTRTEDPTGVQTTQIWGGGGLPAWCLRQITAPAPTPIVTTFGCDTVGNVTIATVGGFTTTTAYDALRRKTGETGPAGTGIQTQWEYGPNGDLIEERRWDATAGAWRVTSSTYSLTGKVLTVTDPSGDLSRTCYDALDRPVTAIDGERRATVTAYNAASQPTEIRRWRRAAVDSCVTAAELPAGQTEERWRRFLYNAAGMQSAEIDARGNTTSQVYDGLGRLAKTIYPNGVQDWMAQDQRGQVVFLRTRSGHQASMFYDAMGRDYHVREHSQANAAYAWTGRNSRASYDLAGRPIWRDVSSQTTTGATFDDALRRDVRTYGYTAGLLTTDQWRPEGVGTGKPTLAFLYGYADGRGNRTSVTWVDAAEAQWTASYAFDAANRARTISFPGAGGTQTVTLSYDSLSRRTAIDRPGAAADTSYAYDDDSDLTSLGHAFASGAGPGAVTFSYGHDAAGKTTSIGIDQSAFEWMPTLAYARTYGAANAMNQITSEAGTAVTFNGAGDMTSDGVNTYVYTFGHRLVSASRAGMTATYDYDSDDRRTRKTVNGVMTRTMWSGADEMAELNSVGAILRRFVPDGSGTMDARLATVENDTPPTIYWQHTDHQGSVIATSNSAGQTVGTASYSPHGEFGGGASAPPLGSPFGYTGRQYDPETGLYQYRARYYSPRLGQFLSADPIGTKDDPNLYLYVGLDPVNYVDPTGNEHAGYAAYSGYVARGGTRSFDQWNQDGRDACNNSRALCLGSFAAFASLVIPGPEDIIIAGLAAHAVRGYLGRAMTARLGVVFGSRLARVEHSMRRIQNIMKNNAKRDDFLGVLREKRGIDTGFDHITEMRQSLRGLETNIARLDAEIASGRLTAAQVTAARASRNAGARTAEAMRRALQ